MTNDQPPTSDHYVQSRRQNIKRFEPRGHDFAVDHDVNRRIEIEIDVTRARLPDQRVIDVRAVVTLREIPYEIEAPRRPPDDVDQPVARVRVRGEHHVAARELAVVEDQQRRARRIRVFDLVQLYLVNPLLETGQAQHDRQGVAGRAQGLEAPVGERGDVGHETKAQDVDEEDLALSVFQPDHVAGARATFDDRPRGVFDAVVGEISQK